MKVKDAMHKGEYLRFASRRQTACGAHIEINGLFESCVIAIDQHCVGLGRHGTKR